MTQAPYRTKLAGLSVILDRVRDDDGILGGLYVSLWRKERGGGAVVSIQLKHRPRTDDHLEVRWNGGRQLAGSDKPELDDLNWESLPSVDWGDEAKMRYTVDAWGDIGQALLDVPPATAAATGGGQRRRRQQSQRRGA